MAKGPAELTNDKSAVVSAAY